MGDSVFLVIVFVVRARYSPKTIFSPFFFSLCFFFFLWSIVCLCMEEVCRSCMCMCIVRMRACVCVLCACVHVYVYCAHACMCVCIVRVRACVCILQRMNSGDRREVEDPEGR